HDTTSIRFGDVVDRMADRLACVSSETAEHHDRCFGSEVGLVQGWYPRLGEFEDIGHLARLLCDYRIE
ncbi:hypothetical protein, partial [Nocardia farcinica]|uniref:hypothetical protein n=1 Tax=Nocardia farcinica TaxID=37329 RepID=UPI001C0EB2A0